MKYAIPLGAALLAIAAGCSGVSDPPLGGPYGGNAVSSNSPNATTSQTDPTDPTDPADPATPGTTSGTPDMDASSGPSEELDAATNSGAADASTASKDAGKDASTPPPPPPSAPTWSAIYSAYFASGTAGHCGNSGCHSQMTTASKSYTWLTSQGYISGTSSALGDPSQSILTWLGGTMPKGGSSSNPSAVSDIQAWIKAGAAND